MKKVIEFLENYWLASLIIILLLNFGLRLLVYYKTVLFNFSDYKIYLTGIDSIRNQGHINLVNGNFLFTISYIGYYAKYVIGSMNYFYIMNCFLGTMTTLIMSILIIRLSGNRISGILTTLILTFYTEFMVFSSVFYTPILTLFLLSLFILLLYYYYRGRSLEVRMLWALLIVLVFIISFLFKPELIFFPIFLGFFSLIFIRNDKVFFYRNLFLVLSLALGFLIFNYSGFYGKVKESEIANDFVFFGHTDYGGNGGEGSFILPENKARYDEAWKNYREEHGINEPTVKDRNHFQLLEMKKFITNYPFKWVGLQFTKFFRTFGVVPETTSFKVLYTGLLKENLWLTSIIVVAPIALIILLFISFLNFSAFKKLFISINEPPPALKANKTSSQQIFNNKHFLYIYILLFFYYLIATIFFGQYQERYRMPVIVAFVIPLLSYFISTFEKEQFLNRISLSVKSIVIVLFVTIWMFQTNKAISDKARFNNAIESVKGAIE